MKFIKYQALGNDYIVMPPINHAEPPTLEQIQRICNRHYGVGSDGILWGPLPDNDAQFGLCLFNPDGSEFEKSGNGLRIFARYLWDEGLVQDKPFTIMSPGGLVTATILDNGKQVSIEMGQISFDSTQIPVKGGPREVLNETLAISGHTFRYCAATIGNPHCVILADEWASFLGDISAQEKRDALREYTFKWGPLIECAPRFPNKTNVQFMRVLDRNNIQIEIWERGAGYTLASGSSSCAAAAVAHRLELCDAHISVHCSGGTIEIKITPDWNVLMTGAVSKICEGTLSDELLAD
ncbi:MAG: diaminopimelate epimerase [Chloroflexota bacterium]